MDLANFRRQTDKDSTFLSDRDIYTHVCIFVGLEFALFAVSVQPLYAVFATKQKMVEIPCPDIICYLKLLSYVHSIWMIHKQTIG